MGGGCLHDARRAKNGWSVLGVGEYELDLVESYTAIDCFGGDGYCDLISNLDSDARLCISISFMLSG